MIHRFRSGLRRAGGAGRGRYAAVVVEFALMVPILAAFMLGMIELSRGIMVRQQLSAAARKGCRTGIIFQYGNVDIKNDVTDVMRDYGYSSTQFNPPSVGQINITVTAPDGTTLSDALDAPSGSTVSVQVVIPVSSITWGSTLYLQSNMIESDTVVMMKQ